MTAMPTDTPIPVRLQNVTKRYGTRTVLDDVSFDVPPGITGLVGPNGAGKSTLVRAILGLVRLAGGTVRVRGLDPAKQPARVRGLTGVVPEDDAAVPGLTGIEMVQYAARLCGLPATEGLRRAHEVLDWCDAGQERYRAIETLSVGMKQKVAFASAIVHDPAIVILDEPTNGLDPLERRAMLGRLVSLARDHGKTILVSTHVLRDVQSICERLVLLVRGRVRLADSIAGLTGSSSAAMRLRGTGAMDALVARLTSRDVPAHVAPDGHGVIIESTDPAAIRTVWEEAMGAGIAVSSLEPERRPLEEVFLAALAEADAGEAVHAPA